MEMEMKFALTFVLHRTESGYQLEQTARSSPAGKHGSLIIRMILECVAEHILGCLHSTWPWKRDATVSEDYALLLMMMIFRRPATPA